MSIDENIRKYLEARGPGDRYASFDYCFNYFQSHWEEGRAGDLAARTSLQLSCLQLGFYLASWGMYRGSTALLQHSVRHLAPVIDVVAHAPPAVWMADAHDYGDSVCDVILDVASRLRRALRESATDTLVTKIMLGTFGCVPAFDTNFRTGSHLSVFNEHSLKSLGQFYATNRRVIDHHRVATLDFDTGQSTHRRYTRAKVIDMNFFVEGTPSSAAEP